MAVTDKTRFFTASPVLSVKDPAEADLSKLAHQLKEVIAEVNKTLHSLSFKREVNLTQFWQLQLMYVKKVVDQLSEDINKNISAASATYGIEPVKVAKAIRNGLFAAADTDREIAAPMLELATRIDAKYGVDASEVNNSISCAA
ncbi:MAG: hypothetical protein K0S08_524 [Gammaproteobacteria bacterium]|jgi:hypothetical protein|nr:hypothetical protein [Gammaproteobacteria bacterium]